VKNITDYGVFMDLGGLDGLMHVTDMSYGKVGTLPTCARWANSTRCGSSASTASAAASPWVSSRRNRIVARPRREVQPGMHVHGKVTNTTKYGAFIEIEEGVEGLLHISEMSWSKRLKDRPR